MGKLSTAGVLRLRATSAVSRDKSVRRSAQDDDFVGILTKNILNKLALMGTQSWLEIRETKSPVGTTESYPEAIPEHLHLEIYSAIENSRSAARIQDHVSITVPVVPVRQAQGGLYGTRFRDARSHAGL
jgi:hypothetical protein